MEKRIFAAIIVSIALLWGWAALAPKLFPELARKPEPAPAAAKTDTAAPAAKTATATSSQAPAAATPTATAAAPVTPISATRVELTVVDGAGFKAVFSNRGAQLVSYRLKHYQRKRSEENVELVKARDPRRTDFPFSIVAEKAALANTLNSALWSVTDRTEGQARIIEYRYAGADGVSATKTFRFLQNRPYLFDFSVTVNSPVKYRVEIGPGIRTLSPEEQDNKILITGNGVVQRDGKFKSIHREKGERVQVFSGIDYVGIEDNYFLSVLRPTKGGEAVIHRVAFFDEKKKRRDDVYASVNATADGVVAGEAFFGPKETKLLDSYGLGAALQFGWFGIIARFLLEALVWVNKATKNYGWAIVVVTIIIKIVLYPLQHKSIVSMKKMQKVQPKVEAIKSKYKKAKSDPDQRQKMNVEMMQLYQKEGINPMAGCLPILLQLPILWGFYGLLSRAIELRGAPFMLWIHDLSDKDPYYITPILMTVTMFIQTWITPSTADPAQRRIFLIMPLIFGFFFKDFPSGLVLYWLVQNVLTIIQQMIMNKWWKEHPAELEKA